MQQSIDALAGKLFEDLLSSELSEAETVQALAIAITLRLAYQTETFEQLLEKLDNLHPIFMQHAKINIEALAAAQHAKARALQGEQNA